MHGFYFVRRLHSGNLSRESRCGLGTAPRGQVREYAPDIYKLLFRIECKHQPSATYMEPALRPGWRTYFVSSITLRKSLILITCMNRYGFKSK